MSPNHHGPDPFLPERRATMLHAQRARSFDPRIVDVFMAHADAPIVLRDRINRTQPTFTDLVDGLPLQAQQEFQETHP